MRTIIRILVAVLIAATLPAAAQANMDWNAAGSTGAIDEGNIAAGNYAFTGTNAHFLIGTAGQIVLRYPVTNTYGSATSTAPPWTTMEMAAIDNGMNGFVRARLIQVDRCSNVETVIATITSPDGNGAVTCSLAAVAGIDFGLYTYYIEVTIARANVNQQASLQYLALY